MSSTPSERAPRWLWGLLLLYFGAHLAVRPWLSDALELDEAEQVLWTQQLALGYGVQPPLYGWLQWLVFQLTGVCLFGLALLKNLLLASIFVFTHLAARKVLAWRWAATAAAAMLLLPQLGWEAQRDLTHTVLATSAAAAVLWLVFELLDRPRPAVYLGLGLAFAAGTLGKYSFVLYAAAMAAALGASPHTRPLLFDRWMLAAAALALALLAPHALWAASHFAAISAGTLAKVQASSAALEAPGALAQGMARLLRALLGFVALPGLVLALVWQRRGGAVEDPTTAPSRAAAALLMRYLAMLAIALLALVASGAATSFKARWLLPLLFMLPLAFVLALPALRTAPRRRALQASTALAAVLILTLLSLRPALDARRGRPDELNLPAAALVRTLRDAGWRGGHVRADTAPLAAALRLHGAASSAARHPGAGAADAADAADGAPTLWIATGGPGASWRTWRGPDAPPCGPVRSIELPHRHARADAPPLRWTYCIAPAR